MVRHYRRIYRTRRSRPLKTVKYSSETQNNLFVFQNGVWAVGNTVNMVAIAAIATQGCRKVKNFRLTISSHTVSPILWALVYVPEGTNPTPIQVGNPNQTASLYEPNQNVIMQGIVNGSSIPSVFRTRLARNLNSGDRIMILFRPTVTQIQEPPERLIWTLNYAVSL